MSNEPTAKRSLVKTTAGRAFRLIDRFLPNWRVTDRQVSRLRYWRAHGRMPRPLTDLRATFNDYIFHRIANDNWRPLERVCIDKQYAKLITSAMCPHVRTAATKLVLPLRGPGTVERARRQLEEHSGLHEVAKPTHGSGSVLFLRKAPSPQDVASFCDTATASFYATSRETQYRGQERKIIVEDDLSAGGEPPADYKFFCTAGEVLFCQVDVGRFVDHRRVLFSPAFEPLDVRYAHDAPDETPARPANFDDMLTIASALSRAFSFVRIDLYSVRGAVYFGEFTFAPEGGTGTLSSEAFGVSVMEKIRQGVARQEFAT
jgi:hypothetical protein